MCGGSCRSIGHIIISVPTLSTKRYQYPFSHISAHFLQRASRKEATSRQGPAGLPYPRLSFHRPTRHNERGPQEHRLTPSFTPAQTHLKTSLSGIRSAPHRRLSTSRASQPRGSEPYPGFWVPAAYVNASAGPPGSSGGRSPTFRSEALRSH